MADGVFDHLYNSDKNETYEVADAQARSDIENLEGELDTKVDKVTGKGLSTNDYTTEEKTKLQGIEQKAGYNNVFVFKATSVMLDPDNSTIVCYILQGALPRDNNNYGLNDRDIVIVDFNGVDASQLPLQSLNMVKFYITGTPTSEVSTYHYVKFRADDGVLYSSGLLNYWKPNSIRTFLFKYPIGGTYEGLLLQMPTADTTHFGEVRLSNSLTDAIQTTAATSYAVKHLKDMIDAIAGGGFSYEIVQSLPAQGAISTTTMYLLPKQTAGTQNVYDEYINPTGLTADWEKIGDTEIDLTNYYTKTETDTLLADKADDVDIPRFASGTGLNLYQSQVGGGRITYSYSIDSTVMSEINDIQNKADSSSLATVATTGSYNDLADKPSIPSGQVQSDWNQSNSSEVDYIKNKPSLANVATTGSALDVAYSGYATGNNVKNAIDDVALDLLNKQDTMHAGTNTTIRDGTIIDVSLRDVKVDGNTRISASDSSPVLLKSGKGIEIDASTTEITFNSTIRKTDSTANATSSTSGTWATRAAVALSEGLWLLVANCYWSSNATGYRYSTIATSPASESGGVGYMRTSATSGQVTNHSIAAIVNVASGTPTYYLNMLQNSGTGLTIGGNFTAVRLGDHT